MQPPSGLDDADKKPHILGNVFFKASFFPSISKAVLFVAWIFM